MGASNVYNKQTVGKKSPFYGFNPDFQYVARNPNSTDICLPLTLWLNTSTGTLFYLSAVGASGATWLTIETGGGGGSFSSLTVSPGPIDLEGTTTINTTSTSNTTIGNLTGSTTIVGTATIGSGVTTGTVSIGGATQTGAITLGASTGTNIVNVGTGAGATTVNVATGLAGSIINLATAANTSAQSINIASGASAANSTVNILSGVSTAGTQTLNVLTGASTNGGVLNLGSGASAIATTIGNTNTSSGITMAVGTGNFTLGGVAGSTYAIGTGCTTGTIFIGGTAQTGEMTFGSSSGAGDVRIAAGTGASVVAIANVQNGGSVSIGAGMTTGTISIGGASQTGAVTLGLSSSGNVAVTPATVSAAAYSATLNARVGQVTLTGQTLASAAVQDLAITNSVISGTTQCVFVSVDNLGSNDAQIQVQRVTLAASTLTVKVKNVGAAALDGNIHVNFWVLN